MTEIITASAQTLAASALFDAGTDLGLLVLGFLGIVALVYGTAGAVGKLRRGSGEAITTQIGVIVFAVLILLSVPISYLILREASDRGIRPPAEVTTVWGR